MWLLQWLVAAACAAAHAFFAYKEMCGWTPEFVQRAAPSWIAGLDKNLAKDRVDWAKKLAFNVGAYNLMLAAGLALTSYSFIDRPARGAMLGTFFAVWLLVAAVAAFRTQVLLAAKVQGVLGLALLLAAVPSLELGVR